MVDAVENDEKKPYRDYEEALRSFVGDGDQATDDDDPDKEFDPCPVIEVTEEEYEEWCKPWRTSLIVKLIGKSIKYKIMKSKLQKLWAINGNVQVIDIPNDYFIAQFFVKEEDYNRALFEGPWMISGHYLAVQIWRPMFRGETNPKSAIWIRIPNFPFELLNDQQFLLEIGSSLGEVLKVDDSRAKKFVRLCVEIDVSKKLVPKIEVMGYELNLEYEGLNQICLQCGRFGHRVDACVESPLGGEAAPVTAWARNQALAVAADDVGYKEEMVAAKDNNEKKPYYEEALLSFVGDDEKAIDHDDLDKEFDPCPVIHISDEEYERLCKPRRTSLIVKLIGKRIKFKIMKSKLQKLWENKGNVKVIDLPNDYFLAQFFVKEEDYNRALFEGPWMIAGHYLAVQRWRPKFAGETNPKSAIWICIPNFPNELHNDQQFLSEVGSSLGEVLKVDDYSRGKKFARLCVEIDLSKKLVPKIEVMGYALNLEYEGLNELCLQCGRFGHRVDKCLESASVEGQLR